MGTTYSVPSIVKYTSAWLATATTWPWRKCSGGVCSVQPGSPVGGRQACHGGPSRAEGRTERSRHGSTHDLPLAEYTKGQVSQTLCSSSGRPVAYSHRSLPTGFLGQGGGRQGMDRERCPTPRDADPNLQPPADRAEIDRLSQRIRDGHQIRETVDVPWCQPRFGKWRRVNSALKRPDPCHPNPRSRNPQRGPGEWGRRSDRGTYPLCHQGWGMDHPWMRLHPDLFDRRTFVPI